MIKGFDQISRGQLRFMRVGPSDQWIGAASSGLGISDGLDLRVWARLVVPVGRQVKREVRQYVSDQIGEAT